MMTDKTVPQFENISDIKVQDALKEANKEGIFAGLTGGLVSAVVGSRLLKFNRNTAMFSGVLGGVLSGYYFAEAFRNTAIAQMRAEDIRLAQAKLMRGHRSS